MQQAEMGGPPEDAVVGVVVKAVLCAEVSAEWWAVVGAVVSAVWGVVVEPVLPLLCGERQVAVAPLSRRQYLECGGQPRLPLVDLLWSSWREGTGDAAAASQHRCRARCFKNGNLCY